MSGSLSHVMVGIFEVAIDEVVKRLLSEFEPSDQVLAYVKMKAPT